MLHLVEIVPKLGSVFTARAQEIFQRRLCCVYCFLTMSSGDSGT